MSERDDEKQPVSISARLGRLQFHKSGKFRILQCADIQAGPTVSKDTIALITASLQAARPDLVIFSGNQIAGYDPAYKATYHKREWSASLQRRSDLEQTEARVRNTVEQITRPLIEAGVPWAVTFGNHDFQCGLSNAQLNAIVCEFEGCVNPRNTAESAEDVCHAVACAALPHEMEYACEPGTFALPVYNEHDRVVLGIALVDSGSYAPTGGYGSPSERALQFLYTLPSKLGRDARTIVFQHTAIPQYYELLSPANAHAAHAVEGYRAFSGQYYVLNDSRTQPGGYLGEGISCPDTDSGEWNILTSTRGYFAIVTGHDHRNGFAGTADGIQMIASPTCGFDSYGPIPERRATRLFEFDIRHPYNPRTQLLEYGTLIGKPSSKKAYAYGMAAQSKPQSEGVNLLHKPTRLSQLMHRITKTLFRR